MREQLERFIRRIGGVHILRELPHGVDVLADVRRALPRLEWHTVFDVGANVGKWTRKLLQQYPDVHVYCFEPVTTTFDALRRSLAPYRTAHCHRVALGEAVGSGRMLVATYSEMSRLATATDESWHVAEVAGVEDVGVTTLDIMCEEMAVPAITYLKIDTEGRDLDVLRGATRMLDDARIDLVEVEAGMNPDNRDHVPLQELKEYLEGRDYSVFGIYEQTPEWPTGEARLRRVNAVFVSGAVVRAHAVPRPARVHAAPPSQQ